MRKFIMSLVLDLLLLEEKFTTFECKCDQLHGLPFLFLKGFMLSLLFILPWLQAWMQCVVYVLVLYILKYEARSLLASWVLLEQIKEPFFFWVFI